MTQCQEPGARRKNAATLPGLLESAVTLGSSVLTTRKKESLKQWPPVRHSRGDQPHSGGGVGGRSDYEWERKWISDSDGFQHPPHPEMETRIERATREHGAATPLPPPLPARGPAPSRPGAHTRTDGQPLQALAVLRRDGVPAREGRPVRRDGTCGHRASEGPGGGGHSLRAELSCSRHGCCEKG